MEIVAQSPSSVGASLDWQIAMKNAIRSGRQLCQRLGVSLENHADAAERDFPVFVPEPYLARIQPNNPRDPLFLQVAAAPLELRPSDGYDTDPVGDHAAITAQGLLQKYAGRALLIATGACAIHCRYCFRRHFPYHNHTIGARNDEIMAPAVDAIAADDSLREVILSGGDPLTWTDKAFLRLVAAIEAIPHVTRLRIHTRLPIVIPSRITPALLSSLQASRLNVVVVIHANHANELDQHASDAVRSIVSHGIPTLNQAVLLRNVNDTVDDQCELSERLIDSQVMPYYLHLLDPVQGAAHFDVPAERGEEIIRGMRARLPGYAVPRLAQEVQGDASKRVIA